jgi:hypothetical protein
MGALVVEGAGGGAVVIEEAGAGAVVLDTAGAGAADDAAGAGPGAAAGWVVVAGVLLVEHPPRSRVKTSNIDVKTRNALTIAFSSFCVLMSLTDNGSS